MGVMDVCRMDEDLARKLDGGLLWRETLRRSPRYYDTT